MPLVELEKNKIKSCQKYNLQNGFQVWQLKYFSYQCSHSEELMTLKPLTIQNPSCHHLLQIPVVVIIVNIAIATRISLKEPEVLLSLSWQLTSPCSSPSPFSFSSASRPSPMQVFRLLGVQFSMCFLLRYLYIILINFLFGFVFALFTSFFLRKLACLDRSVNYFFGSPFQASWGFYFQY